MKLMLKVLESTLNKVLALDVQAISRIQLLEGKCIEIRVIDWHQSFFIFTRENRLYLHSSAQSSDVVISGELFSLIKTVVARASTASLFDESVTIKGDPRVAEKLRDLILKLNIDWEEQLSKVLGDNLAHPIAVCIKKAFDASRYSIKSLKENLSEYWHYESQQLVPPGLVNRFANAVHELRDRVDRAEVLVKKLMSSV